MSPDPPWTHWWGVKSWNLLFFGELSLFELCLDISANDFSVFFGKARHHFSTKSKIRQKERRHDTSSLLRKDMTRIFNWLFFSSSVSFYLAHRVAYPGQRQRFLRHELYCQLRLCAEEARPGPADAGQDRGQFDTASHETEGIKNRQRDLLRETRHRFLSPRALPTTPPLVRVPQWKTFLPVGKTWSVWVFAFGLGSQRSWDEVTFQWISDKAEENFLHLVTAAVSSGR